MTGLDCIAVAIGVGIVIAFVAVVWMAIGHAAYLIGEERRAKGIEVSPTPGRERLGIETNRPRRGEHRPGS